MKRTVIKVLSAALIMTALVTGSVFAAPEAGSIIDPVIPTDEIILQEATREKADYQQASQGIHANSRGRIPRLDSWSSNDGAVFWDSITPEGSSAWNIYMNAEGIAGESESAENRDQIELISYFFGADKTVKPVDPANKYGLKLLRVYKNIDRSSPEFLRVMLGGNKINTLAIEAKRGADGQHLICKLVLNNAVVASLKQGIGGQGNIEEVCFSYSGGELTYFRYSPTGTIEETIITLIPGQD